VGSQRRGVSIIDWVFLLALLSLGTLFAILHAHTGNITLGMFEWAFWYLGIALAVLLTHRPIGRIAAAIGRRVGNWVDRSTPWLLLFCAWGCAGFLASAPGRAKTILADSNAAPSALTTVLFATLVGTVAGLIQMTPTHRLRAFNKLRRIGWFGPLILTGSFLVCVVSFFTYNTLYSDERFDGVADVESLSAGRVASFYLWHFFKLLPFGDLPGTLNWREPLTYHGTDVGRRVVAFQLATTTTIVAAIRAYWKFRQQESVTEPTKNSIKPSRHAKRSTPSENGLARTATKSPKGASRRPSSKRSTPSGR
jgi:hypothetical protein